MTELAVLIWYMVWKYPKELKEIVENYYEEQGERGSGRGVKGDIYFLWCKKTQKLTKKHTSGQLLQKRNFV